MDEKFEELKRCLNTAEEMFYDVLERKQTLPNWRELSEKHYDIESYLHTIKKAGFETDDAEKDLSDFLDAHPTYKFLVEEESRLRLYIADIKQAMKKAA